VLLVFIPAGPDLLLHYVCKPVCCWCSLLLTCMLLLLNPAGLTRLELSHCCCYSRFVLHAFLPTHVLLLLLVPAGLTRLELSYCGEEGLYSIPTNLS